APSVVRPVSRPTQPRAGWRPAFSTPTRIQRTSLPSVSSAILHHGSLSSNVMRRRGAWKESNSPRATTNARSVARTVATAAAHDETGPQSIAATNVVAMVVPRAGGGARLVSHVLTSRLEEQLDAAGWVAAGDDGVRLHRGPQQPSVRALDARPQRVAAG